MAEKKKHTVVKRSVSFRSDVFEHAMKQADDFHGGNLSAYLTYLVSADKHGVTRVLKEQQGVELDDLETKQQATKDYVKTEENDAYVDQFLNL